MVDGWDEPVSFLHGSRPLYAPLPFWGNSRPCTLANPWDRLDCSHPLAVRSLQIFFPGLPVEGAAASRDRIRAQALCFLAFFTNLLMLGQPLNPRWMLFGLVRSENPLFYKDCFAVRTLWGYRFIFSGASLQTVRMVGFFSPLKSCRSDMRNLRLFLASAYRAWQKQPSLGRF